MRRLLLWYNKQMENVSSLYENLSVALFVGPSGVGKTAIINRLVRDFPDDYHKVQSATTRLLRSDDKPGAYRYLSHATANQMVENGKFAQYSIHPGSGELYGTLTMDYDNEKLNVLDVMTDAVQQFRALEFGSIAVIGVIATRDEWLRRMMLRYPRSHKESDGRYREGLACLDWIDTYADDVIDTTMIDNDKAAHQVHELLVTRLRSLATMNDR